MCGWIGIPTFVSSPALAIILRNVLVVIGDKRSMNNKIYQFAVFNCSSIKDAKIDEHHKLSFAPEMAAKGLIDKKKYITFV